MCSTWERARLCVVFDSPGTYPWRRFAARRWSEAAGARRRARSRPRTSRSRAAGVHRTGGRGSADVRRRRGRRGRRAAPARGSRRPRRIGHALEHAARSSTSARTSGAATGAARPATCAAAPSWPQRGGSDRARRARERELAATGARPRKVMLSGVESLTARASGRGGDRGPRPQQQGDRAGAVRDREDGRAALSNVYRKLQIGSRRQLAAALPRARPSLPAAG
jgi:hypothetical protein